MAQSDLDKMVFYARDELPAGATLTASVSDRGLLQLDSPTTHFGPADGGDVAGVAIGFTFHVGGVAYTTCTVCTAGFVQFAGSVDYDNANLFAANSDVIIAPWYDATQLTAYSNPAGGSVSGYLKSETQGTAPFRRFVVEWFNNVYVALSSHLIRYQLVLYETKDAFEFRYAPPILSIGPAPTASRGIKVGTDYRNLSWPTGSGLMGGDLPPTAHTTLDIDTFREFVPYVFVGEPNWPMCGRAFMVNPDMITGRDIFGSSDVIWRIANFVNWLWCRHTPPLINIAPYEETDRSTVTYVVPCSPSDEGLPYRVYVQVWATAGANCTVEIYEDAAADPQPGTGGDWSLIDSEVQAVTGSAWNELTSYVIAIDQATTHLRFVVSVSSGNLRLGSVMLVPNQASDIDETYTSLTGFVPMAIGMLRNLKAPVHPEWFNRAWANIAHILRDRRQMVWSSVWPELSLTSLTSTVAKPVRVIGTSKAWLPVRGAECKARIYARDTTGGAPLMVSEAGNGLIGQWTVGDNGGEYRTQDVTTELISDEPHITATCEPEGTLSPMAVVVDWSPALSTASLFPGVTPAPRLAHLFALVARMDFALRCNVATGLATLLARGKTSSNKWRVQTWVGPAIGAMRAKVARDNGDPSAASGDTLIYAASSGSGADDEIYIETPHDRGRDEYPPEGRVEVVASSEDFDAAPSATMSRLLESPTATVMTGGARERVEIVRGVGVVFVPARFADPQAL